MVRKGCVFIFFVLLVLARERVYAVLQGDANGDGVVNGKDYIIWLNNYGITNATGQSQGDFNADGTVNGKDYIFWLNNYGKTDTGSADPTPPTLTNVLTNPGFETGSNSQWTGGASTVTNSIKHTGTYALKVTGNDEQTQTVRNLTAGKKYTFTGWFSYGGPLGDGFGQTRFEADGHVLTNYHDNMLPNTWYKLAVTFTASSTSTTLKFGLWGPKSTAALYYDDFMLFESPTNIPPVINPQASTQNGQSPLAITFSANEDDYDGAITSLRWKFGDGSEEVTSKPSHTYIAAGNYQVTLTATDNNLASTTKSLTITVSDPTSPTVSFNSPATGTSFTTSAASVSLAGSSTTSTGQINKIVWDNVSLDEVGTVTVTPGTSINWSAGTIALKPGRNEVLVTATSTTGSTGVSRMVITRTISGPSVRNIIANTQTMKAYEKYELTFDVDTVADQYMFMYDPNPPPGVSIYSGVTVEGIVTKPDGTQSTHPGFYMSDVTTSGSNYIDTGLKHWKLRISPQQTGQYQVAIRVTDKSGTYTSPVQNFTAQSPTSDGFIQVSQADPRFFQYSSGKIFWPIGMTWAGGGSHGLTPDGVDLSNSVLNYERGWMGGVGAYTTRWPRWFSTMKPEWGNEGAEVNAIFTEHYPGHELSQPLTAGKGYRIWIGWLAYAKTALKPSTTYQIKLRAKTNGITGSGTGAGLVVKHHSYWSIYDQPTASMLSQASMITPITGTHDWFTTVNRYTTPSNTSDTDFSIYLQNVTSGSAYIDELSIREVNTNGTLGGEIIASSLADQHTYVDQRPMKFFDEDVVAGEKNDVHIRYVVHDKNDWIQGHLSMTTGQFVNVGDGYYQPENTKATWLLKQWWRYLVARLGYSTGILGFELNNEGPPDDGSGSHAAMTGVFTKWLHTLDMHPHLNSTSFWCCWEPKFWGDKVKYPFVDFGDIHHYAAFSDMVAFHLDDAIPVQNDNIKRPVVMGERGLTDDNGNNFYTQLKSPNKGTWYHDMLWSQLHASTLYEIGYWHPEHINGFSRETMAKPFYNFVSTFDANQGGYSDITATSGNSSLQVFGQKNLNKNEAYAWIRNNNHTWKNVESNVSISPISTSVIIKMNPSKSYSVMFYNTYSGATTSTQNIASDGSGNLSIPVSNLTDDFAIKIQ